MPELIATANGATLMPLLIGWACLAAYLMRDRHE